MRTLRSPFGKVLREADVASGVSVIAIEYADGSMLAPHRHDVAYTSVVISGVYTEVCESRPRRCGYGTVLVHEASEEHTDFFTSDAICINIYSTDRRLGFERSVSEALRATQSPTFQAYFESIVSALTSVKIDDDRPKSTAVPGWLTSLLDTFDWTGRAGLSDAAEIANLHPTHFARSFRKAMGMTPSEYRINARVSLATERLLRTSASIACIAAEAGFFDQSDLTNRFTRLSGMSPARFRSVFKR